MPIVTDLRVAGRMNGTLRVSWTEPELDGFSTALRIAPGPPPQTLRDGAPVATKASPVVVRELTRGDTYGVTMFVIDDRGQVASRATATVAGAAHELSLGRSRVRYGRTRALRASLTTADGEPLTDAPVRIRVKDHGRPWRRLTTIRTGPDGVAAMRIGGDANRRIRAIYRGGDGAWAAVSNRVTLRVRPVVRAAVRDGTPPVGETVVLRARVAPNHKGQRVVLQQRLGTKWQRVAGKVLGARSGTRWNLDVARGLSRYRVVVPRHADHIPGRSRVVRIRGR